MRHRLFHAIVVVGAATGCGSSTESYNPPPPDTGVASDTAVQPDTATTEAAVTDSASVDSAKAPDTGADTCVDEGCGCMPCIK